jgi:predicted outer membrane protein
VADAASYVHSAGITSLFELAISQLVIARTDNSAIRNFANRAVETFNGATNELGADAGELEVPRALDQANQELYDTLERADDDRLDATYLELQQRGIEAATVLYGNYASHGADGPLRQHARRWLSETRRLNGELLELQQP